MRRSSGLAGRCSSSVGAAPSRMASLVHNNARSRRVAARCSSAPGSSSSGQQDSLSQQQQPQQQSVINLGDGDAILLRAPPPEVGPRFAYTHEEAMQVQLQVIWGR